MKYIKKPIPVDAWQIDMLEIVNQGKYPEWVHDAFRLGRIKYIKGVTSESLVINTLEGMMTAAEGDYLIKGPKGEYWFNKKHIFEEMYEEWDGSYEYDTGRPIRGAAKKIGTFEVIDIKENADGSANYEFSLSEDVKESLVRAAIRTALENAVKKGDEWKVREPDEQPTTKECDWPDEAITCRHCDCWKSG